MRGALAFAVALDVAAATSVSPSRAADPVVEARADYDAAAAAYDRADYATAAVRFARADERVPNARALQLAMSAALLASDAGLAMNLVERSEARARAETQATAVNELTRKLRQRYQRTAGRIVVSCPAGVECLPSLDGEPIGAARTRWVTPGDHVLALATAAGVAPVSRKVTVRAGETVEVELGTAGGEPEGRGSSDLGALPAPRGDRTAPATPSAGLPPAVFWTALGATGLAVATSTLLTVVVANRHDDFVARPSAETADAGDAAQTRARVAWSVSAAFAVTTVAIGLMTRFGSGGRDPSLSTPTSAARPSPRFTMGVGPLAASFTGTF
jgi:hypothetical protein